MQGTHTFTNEDIEELTEAVNRLIKMTTQKTAGQKKTLHTFVHFFVKCLELVQVALIPMYYAIMT